MFWQKNIFQDYYLVSLFDPRTLQTEQSDEDSSDGDSTARVQQPAGGHPVEPAREPPGQPLIPGLEGGTPTCRSGRGGGGGG